MIYEVDLGLFLISVNVILLISIRLADCPYNMAKTVTLQFLRHYKYYKCQTLHDGSTH